MPAGVSLVHITPNAQEHIAYLARVSNPSNQDNTKTSAKLIRYMIKHQHWSPFEMVSMCCEVNTTRAIAAQILRHRSFSFQEFSQRYADASELGYEQPELRLQHPTNRQSSVDGYEPKPSLATGLEFALKHSLTMYNRLLSNGVAKECARSYLPLCTNTRLYMHGTIRSWLHYCDLRCKPETQKEHRLLAEQAKSILKDQLPDVFEAMWPEAKPLTRKELLKGKAIKFIQSL